MDMEKQEIYVIGGIGGEDEIMSTVEVLNLTNAKNTWKLLPEESNSPCPRFNQYAVHIKISS